MRRSYVQVDGVLYEKGTEPKYESNDWPTIMPDLPDFVSPIDGTVVRGRAGLRDHCARHGVVPTADLAGLPHRRAVKPESPLEDIKRVMIQKGYWNG
jgi:hypothetical protein